MDGLGVSTDVGESAADDDRHGVVEVRPAHLVFNIDGEQEGGASALDCTVRAVWIVWVGAKGELRILIVCHGLCIYYRRFGGMTPGLEHLVHSVVWKDTGELGLGYPGLSVRRCRRCNGEVGLHGFLLDICWTRGVWRAESVFHFFVSFFE